MSQPIGFDDEWATPPQWADMYRALGLQVVPAKTPREDRENFKRPIIAWREFEDELTPQAVHDRWYEPKEGEHRGRRNMGLIMGRASGNAFCLDLDLHKENGRARAWWADLLAENAHGIEPPTPSQRTGGGGRQLLFRAPPGWSPPTFKTPIGIDIRGQGGFMMAPPSMHSSGKIYDWEKDRAPWQCGILDAPEWLIEAIEQLREEHGGQPVGPRERTPSTGDQNAFGLDVDGREEKLQKLVWAAVVDMYRDAPIPPTQDEQDAEKARIWRHYLQTTKSRLTRPGIEPADLLEMEGRGWSELDRKWRYAMRKWDNEVKAAAAIERPRSEPRHEEPQAATASTPSEGLDLYEVLTIADIRALPEAAWIVKGAIQARSLGFIYGPPGSYKSFACYDLALSIAYDFTEWLGRPVQAGGSVLYIASEGISGAKNRITAWQQQYGVAEDTDRFRLIRKTINFMEAGDVERLERTVADQIMRHGPVSLIFVDTVSRVLPGADENLQKDMTIFVAACDRLRDFGATVVGVHHTNKNGDMRGSTVFLGQGDFIFRIEKVEGQKAGILTCEKQKEAEDGWKAAFEAKSQSWSVPGSIEPVTSLVAVFSGEPATVAPVSEWPPRDTCKAILKEIQAAWDKGRPWSPHARAATEGRFAVRNISQAFSLKSSTVQQMLEAWLVNDVIVLDVVDAHSKAKGLKVLQWLD
jgi:hypothetical protein